jgi:hypothetical protein
MALAPRTTGAKYATNEITGQTRDSGLGATGKRDQRARNKTSDTAKLTTSGSSGKALSVAKMPKVPFAEVEEYVTHLCDIAAKISHTQMGGTGWLSSTLNVPLEYVHDVAEAHAASQQGMIYVRVYYVDTENYLHAGGVTEDGMDNGE